MKIRVGLSVVAAALTLGAVSGCASITQGWNQLIYVFAMKNGEMVRGAYCKLENIYDTAYVISPGNTSLQREFGDLTVTCTKFGMAPGIVRVSSRTGIPVFGNIIYGGLTGAAIDVADGAAYKYPERIYVEMGVDQTISARRSADSGATSTPASGVETTPVRTPEATQTTGGW